MIIDLLFYLIGYIASVFSFFLTKVDAGLTAVLPFSSSISDVVVSWFSLLASLVGWDMTLHFLSVLIYLLVAAALLGVVRVIIKVYGLIRGVDIQNIDE